MGYSFLIEKFNKNWIRGLFLMENGQIEAKTCKFESNNTFKLGKGSYIVDQSLIRYDKNIPYLFYQHDNPNPISFIKVKNVINGKVISSENFNDVLDSKVIKEMVMSGQSENLLLILICVVGLIGLLNIGATMGMFNPHMVNATANMTANMTIIR